MRKDLILYKEKEQLAKITQKIGIHAGRNKRESQNKTHRAKDENNKKMITIWLRHGFPVKSAIAAGKSEDSFRWEV